MRNPSSGAPDPLTEKYSLKETLSSLPDVRVLGRGAKGGFYFRLKAAELRVLCSAVKGILWASFLTLPSSPNVLDLTHFTVF
jgi:hypothetical protein